MSPALVIIINRLELKKLYKKIAKIERRYEECFYEGKLVKHLKATRLMKMYLSVEKRIKKLL